MELASAVAPGVRWGATIIRLAARPRFVVRLPLPPPSVGEEAWRSPADSRSPLGVAALLLSVLTAGIGFGLRTWQLGVPSLWYDEGVSWALARMPVQRLLDTLATTDFNPPFYPLLLHWWMPLAGASEYALRFPSALAGTLALPLCWVLTWRCLAPWAGRRVALAAAALASVLAATSVFLTDFSQEARAYSLVTALSLLSAYSLLRLAGSPLRPIAPSPRSRWWLCYVLSTAAALLTHDAALLVLPAHLLIIWLSRRRAFQRGALIALVAVAAIYACWLPGLWRQVATMRLTPDFWRGHISPLLAPTRALAAVVAGPGAFADNPPALLIGGGVVLLAVAVGAVLVARGDGLGLCAVALLALTPLVEAALLTAAVPKFIDRYLLLVAPVAYVAVSGGLVASTQLVAGRRRALRFATRGVVAALAGLLAVGSVVLAARHGPLGAVGIKDGDTRTAVAFIEAHAAPGDAILLAQDTSDVFSYYYNGMLGGEGTGWFRVATEYTRGDDVPALAATLNAAAAGHTRLWALLWHEDFADPTGFIRGALSVHGTQVLAFKGATGYDIRLYNLEPGVLFSAQASPLHPMSVRFGPSITFLGDGLEQWDEPADVPFTFHTWYRTDRPLDRDYQAVLRLERDGQVWQQVAMRPASYNYPAPDWLPGVDVPGRLDFRVGTAVPPADYHVTLAIYDPANHQDLAAVDASRGPIGTRVDLGLVRVLSPMHPGYDKAPPEHPVKASIDGGLVLLGSDTVPTQLEPGATKAFSLIWAAVQRPTAAFDAQIELAGRTGNQVVAPWSPPAPGLSTDQWPGKETIRDVRMLRLPARALAGPAILQVRLRRVDGVGGDAVVPLGQVMVVARLRSMTEPPLMERRVGALFGDAAWLEGLDVDDQAARPGGQVTVTLYWNCRASLADDYKVFVHLLDAANAIGGRQHDGEPNGGSDPTTSWVPNQWITDRHVVPIPANTPPGEYRLELGLYRAAEQRFPRLPLATGRDSIIAGAVPVRSQ